MNQAINPYITDLNNIGQGFWDYAAGIFIQSGVLIILLLVIDFLLRNWVLPLPTITVVSKRSLNSSNLNDLLTPQQQLTI